MSLHLLREIETLKKHLLEVGAIVEENVIKSVRAFQTADTKLAQQIINADKEIDTAEVEIEEECLKILALYQPVAVDLRFIVAILKIDSDLERIGDLAVNIAERAFYLAGSEKPDVYFDFTTMTNKTMAMLKKSLDSLVNLNADLAREVGAQDDEVDAMKREMTEVVKKGIEKNPAHTDQLLHYLLVARHLERIADHAANIAEDVIYMVNGEIVRHKWSGKKYVPDMGDNR